MHMVKRYISKSETNRIVRTPRDIAQDTLMDMQALELEASRQRKVHFRAREI
jgi:hypothetical protein